MTVYLVYLGDLGRFDIFSTFEDAEESVLEWADGYYVDTVEHLESEVVAGVHPRDGLGILEYRSKDDFYARIQSRTVIGSGE